jgi:hypothetical protein
MTFNEIREFQKLQEGDLQLYLPKDSEDCLLNFDEKS